MQSIGGVKATAAYSKLTEKCLGKAQGSDIKAIKLRRLEEDKNAVT
jgi:hypothetical protein